MQSIDRCPRTCCNGKLKYLAVGEGRRVSGYVGDKKALYRCLKCNIGFIITNPNSFIED